MGSWTPEQPLSDGTGARGGDRPGSGGREAQRRAWRRRGPAASVDEEHEGDSLGAGVAPAALTPVSSQVCPLTSGAGGGEGHTVALQLTPESCPGLPAP